MSNVPKRTSAKLPRGPVVRILMLVFEEAEEFQVIIFPFEASPPYISVSGGPTVVDSIDITTFADFSAIGGPSDTKVFHGRYFQGSLIGTAAGMLGLEYALTGYVKLRW